MPHLAAPAAVRGHRPLDDSDPPMRGKFAAGKDHAG
jgi:hypothetical protein